MKKQEFIFERDVTDIQVTEIKVKGWYNPLYVEYGLSPFGESTTFQMCWRVKGTEHVFTIPLNMLYEHSQEGDYEEHFKEVLGVFRLDYLDWYKQGFKYDWMQKYRHQFKNYIYTFE